MYSELLPLLANTSVCPLGITQTTRYWHTCLCLAPQRNKRNKGLDRPPDRFLLVWGVGSPRPHDHLNSYNFFGATPRFPRGSALLLKSEQRTSLSFRLPLSLEGYEGNATLGYHLGGIDSPWVGGPHAKQWCISSWRVSRCFLGWRLSICFNVSWSS